MLKYVLDSESRALSHSRSDILVPSCQMVGVVQASEKDVTVPNKTKTRVRAARNKPPPEKSMSIENVPAELRTLFQLAVIPTILDVYGSEANPWDLNHDHVDGLFFATTLENAMDKAFPHLHYRAPGPREDKDIIWKVVRLIPFISCSLPDNHAGTSACIHLALRFLPQRRGRRIQHCRGATKTWKSRARPCHRHGFRAERTSARRCCDLRQAAPYGM